MMNNQRDTYLQLRSSFDGSDPFMTGGHQIHKTRSSNRKVPEWTTSDKGIQQILLRAFPTLKTNIRQRARAARWARVIYLYYRTRLTKADIAHVLKLNYGTV